MISTLLGRPLSKFPNFFLHMAAARSAMIICASLRRYSYVCGIKNVHDIYDYGYREHACATPLVGASLMR